MPRKESQQPQAARVDPWDINGPLSGETRKKLWQMDHELKSISAADPETKYFEFGFWCVNKKYIRIDGKYNRIERLYSNVLGRHYKKVEYTSVRKGFQDEAMDRYNALRKLLAAQLYAKKQEHIRSLCGEPCCGTPDSGNRCEMCYPLAFQEIAKVSGWQFPDMRMKKKNTNKVNASILPAADVELKKRVDERSTFDDPQAIHESDLPF